MEKLGKNNIARTHIWENRVSLGLVGTGMVRGGGGTVN